MKFVKLGFGDWAENIVNEIEFDNFSNWNLIKESIDYVYEYEDENDGMSLSEIVGSVRIESYGDFIKEINIDCFSEFGDMYFNIDEFKKIGDKVVEIDVESKSIKIRDLKEDDKFEDVSMNGENECEEFSILCNDDYNVFKLVKI